ncbi:MAG TPA: hypothetical protein VIM30_06365 [Candidatus Limnocylindrales bacterium]
MLASSELGEVAIAPVGDDRLDARQLVKPLGDQITPHSDVMRLGRIDAHGERQPQDFDEDAAFRADRPPASTAGVVERGPRPSAAHLWASIITIVGSMWSRLRERMMRASRLIARALVPVLLGGGVPFFEQLKAAPILLDGPSLVVEGERVTHLRYTIRRP